MASYTLNQKRWSTKRVPRQDQSKGRGLDQNYTSHSAELIKLSAQPECLPHQTGSHNKWLLLTLMGIYGKIVQQKVVVRYLEELSNYKTTEEGSAVFVSVAGKGRERRGSEVEGTGGPLVLRHVAIHKQWNYRNDTERGIKRNFEEIWFLVIKSFW